MSAATMDGTLAKGVAFYEAHIGKKAVMAVTGFLLFVFVVGHLIGNLQIYQGPQKINDYGVMLRKIPALLWTARIGLLALVTLHVTAAIQLWLLKRRARPIAYVKKASVASDYASRTMLWSGPIIGAFVVYHLLHFTLGTVLPGGLRTTADGHIDVYANVVAGFSQPLVAGFYILAMVLLGLHLYHGLWSMFQSLGVNHPRYTPWLKRFAAVFSVALAGGNISIPINVLSGIIH